MSLPIKYYLPTVFCSRNEVQLFNLEDGKLLYIVHPDNLFDFLCLNSDKVTLISYNEWLLSRPDEEIEKATLWFQARFRGEITLGALPSYPRNINS